MKKLFFALLLLTPTCALAQIYTPFNTPRREVPVDVYDASGLNVIHQVQKKQYSYPDDGRFARVSLSMSYGLGAVSTTSWYPSKILHTQLNAQNIFSSRTTSTDGTWSLALNITATPWLEVSIPFILTKNQGELEDLPMGYISAQYRETWFSMMPGIKVSWLYNDWLHVYSRAAVGWTLVNRHQNNDTEINHKFALAYQASPVGVEMGRRVAFFLEAGYGYTGMVTAGLKVRFHETKSKNNEGHRKRSNWYMRYLR